MRRVSKPNPIRISLGDLVDLWSSQPGAISGNDLLESIMQAFWRGDLGDDAILLDGDRYEDLFDDDSGIVANEHFTLSPEFFAGRLSFLKSPIAERWLQDQRKEHFETARLADYGERAIKKLLRKSLIIDPAIIEEWSALNTLSHARHSVPFLGLDPDGDLEHLKLRHANSPAEVRRWYKDVWIIQNEREGHIPSREEDLAAARSHFGADAVSIAMMRKLRRELAPAHWKTGGRPMKAPT